MNESKWTEIKAEGPHVLMNDREKGISMNVQSRFVSYHFHGTSHVIGAGPKRDLTEKWGGK